MKSGGLAIMLMFDSTSLFCKKTILNSLKKLFVKSTSQFVLVDFIIVKCRSAHKKIGRIAPSELQAYPLIQ